MRAGMAMLVQGAGGGGTSYLDDLASAPACALSLRKMISTATIAIRVRRSSDNAEQDIGFSGDALDMSALASFVGSNSAYVTKVYDQTGNGFDAVQATAANQPRIVNAGTYDGKIVFDGSNDFLKIPSLVTGTPYIGAYTKLKQSNSGLKMMLELGADGQTTAGGFALLTVDSTRWQTSMGNTGGGRSNLFNVTSLTALTQVTALYDRTLTGTNESKLWIAGGAKSASAGSTGEQTGNFATLDLNIGCRNSSAYFADMWLDTLALYTADTSSIRTGIEAIIT